MTNLEEIISITEAAVEKIQELIESRGRGKLAVRVIVRGRLPGGGYQSEFKFVDPGDILEEDIVQETDSFDLLFDESCAESLGGAVVDFDEEKYSAGFNIQYSTKAFDEVGPMKKDWGDPVSQAVQKVIEDEINPGIAAHGGWVELLDVKDEIAYIEMGGGCQGCGLSDVTLTSGIQRLIIERVSEINQVIDSTDHAEGTNPYYSPAKGADSGSLESPIAGD